MLIMFALGAMSVVWMLVVSGLIFAEKVLPCGERLSRGFAVWLVVLGIWVAASPTSVPGLTQPGGAQMMRGSSSPSRRTIGPESAAGRIAARRPPFIGRQPRS